VLSIFGLLTCPNTFYWFRALAFNKRHITSRLAMFPSNISSTSSTLVCRVATWKPKTARNHAIKLNARACRGLNLKCKRNSTFEYSVRNCKEHCWGIVGDCWGMMGIVELCEGVFGPAPGLIVRAKSIEGHGTEPWWSLKSLISLDFIMLERK
jgi:hypothetical protein